MHASPTLVPAALALFAAPVRAQDILYSFPAQTTHRIDAAPVEALGDVDGDGLPDFALGQALGGGVEVRSGIDGAVLVAIPDPNLNALYATALARIDDLDGDGVDDLAVGSSHSLHVGSAGFVELRSGADGALLGRFPGPVDQSFGRTVEAIGDLDGDGLEDLVVGTPENFVSADGPTAVQAVSSADGAVLWRVERPNADGFGSALARLADLDGDGVDEVAAPVFPFGAPAVRILSGISGALVREIPGAAPGFGSRLARVGDLDGDGFDELAIASLLEEQGPGRVGVVRVYRSVDGSVLREHRPSGPHGAFGVALDAGDLDRDGVPDLVVGQSILEAVVFEGDLGAVLAFSGADGHLLMERLGDVPQGEFGNAVAFLGDGDGDGRRDVVATGLFKGAGFSAFGRGISLRETRLRVRPTPDARPAPAFPPKQPR